MVEQQTVSSMSTVAKLASILSLSSMFFGFALTPAHALRIPNNGEGQPTSERSASAYAGDKPEAYSFEASILTADEVRHIKWCAGRYTMGYDAVSDTYAGAGGRKLQCRSPR